MAKNNNNTIMLVLAAVAVYYIWKKSKAGGGGSSEAGNLVANQVAKTTFVPDTTTMKDLYNADQSACK